MRTTLAVTTTTRDRLLRLKQAWGVASVDDVLARFLDGAPLGAKALYAANQVAVDAVLRQHRVSRLVAFGSRARGDARPDSDLDVVVTLPDDADLFDLVDVQDALSTAFGVPVHATTPQALRQRLKANVDQDGVVLFG